MLLPFLAQLCSLEAGCFSYQEGCQFAMPQKDVYLNKRVRMKKIKNMDSSIATKDEELFNLDPTCEEKNGNLKVSRNGGAKSNSILPRGQDRGTGNVSKDNLFI